MKIHTKFRPRQWDRITVPVIKMEGKWLSKLGFNEGDHINIETKPKKLIITLIEKEVH